MNSVKTQALAIIQPEKVSYISHTFYGSKTTQRTRYLFKIHHASRSKACMGFTNPDTRRSLIYRWSDHCAWPAADT